MKKALIFGVIFLASLNYGCKEKKQTEEVKKQVNVISPVRQDISETVLMTGSIEAESYAEIFPRAPGKVIKKFLKDGDPVKKNQTILLTQQDEVGYTFKPAPVVSTIDGSIGRITVDIGSTVSPNLPVATVVKADKMRIKVDVPESYLPNLKVGNEIKGETFTAKISSISSSIDVKSRTGRVEFLVDNKDGSLIHGMFTRLEVPVKTNTDALIIPVSAVSFEGANQYVFKVIDGRVSKTPIKMGIRSNSHIEVLEGLSEKDLIVKDNLLELSHNDQVFQ